MRGFKPPFEPVHEVEANSPLEAATALAGTRGLVARVSGGIVTLDALIVLAARRRLHRAQLKEAMEGLPFIGGRLSAARALSLYVARGGKYALTPRGALTPRSVYAAAALHPADIVARASPPAMVSPNTTLRGALARMAERGSICAFVARAGRLKGVVDAWTILGEAAGKGEEGLEASCSGYGLEAALVGTLEEAAEALADYGFAAITASHAILIDDVSLHRALISSAGRWLPRVR